MSKATFRRMLIVGVRGIACTRRGETARERFVGRFLQSIRDDTEFYRRYTPNPSRALEMRSRYPGALTGDLRIVHREEYSDGTFEYGAECGPSLACIVYLTERGGAIISADLTIERTGPP